MDYQALVYGAFLMVAALYSILFIMECRFLFVDFQRWNHLWLELGLTRIIRHIRYELDIVLSLVF